MTDLVQLLEKFVVLPKSIRRPTYLEICKYPRRRFEEICSRLLCFYLNPYKEHQLHDLFLYSLFKILAPDTEFNFQNERIRVISEENANGKRLDILVYSDTFVVGIENKIDADLYNPLDIYKDRIQMYGSENVYRIVLSLRRLTTEKDLRFIKDQGFINVTYSEYFALIKENCNKYHTAGNENYIQYLNDFMETIENMTNFNSINSELSDYFFDNTREINELISLFTQFNNETKNRQREKILELRELVVKLTGSENWKIYEGWDLYFCEFNPDLPKIGIESYFIPTKGNPLGIFRITITAWSLNDWSSYESDLKNDLPGCQIEKRNNRAFLYAMDITNENEDEILSGLKKYFEYLTKLTTRLV